MDIDRGMNAFFIDKIIPPWVLKANKNRFFIFHVIYLFSKQKSSGEVPKSGLRGRFAKPLAGVKFWREFKSLPLRHIVYGRLYLRQRISGKI